MTKERYGILSNYRPIMISQPYEWCQIMQDAQFNPIYKLFVQAVSNSVPELFHPCPYWVIAARNWNPLRMFFNHRRASPTPTTWPSTWTKSSASSSPAITPTRSTFSTISTAASLRLKFTRPCDESNSFDPVNGRRECSTRCRNLSQTSNKTFEFIADEILLVATQNFQADFPWKSSLREVRKSLSCADSRHLAPTAAFSRRCWLSKRPTNQQVRFPSFIQFPVAVRI